MAQQGMPSEEIFRLALQSHLERNSIKSKVTSGFEQNTFLIAYEHESSPLVSIIIATGDCLDLSKSCIDGLLLKTSYPNYEIIIVINEHSNESEILAYVETLETSNRRIRVINYPEQYNFSAISNLAANQARGEYLLFLDHDTLIIQDNWLERMLAHGQRQEVGVVGCRLVSPDQRIQHAGVVLGMDGTVGYPGRSYPLNDPGYMGRAQVVQNFSAVTVSCMLLRKSLYFEVGGLDEEHFPVFFSEVDFCLKVGELGYKIVWTPFATVLHFGSSSLKQETDPRKVKHYREADSALLEKWLPKLACDPAYNRNLSLRHRDWRVETETDFPWDVNIKDDRPRIWAAPCNSFGTGEYRVRAPLRALEQAGRVQYALLPNHDHDNVTPLMPEVVELERAQPDILFLQNAFLDLHIEALKAYNRLYPKVFRIFGQDDLVFELPQKSSTRQSMYKDARKRLRQALSLCDRLIVATEPMAKAMRDMIEDIRVVPNYLEKARWQGLTSQRKRGSKPRVGWAGGEQHQGDLEILLPVIKETAGEVEWVFFGICPTALKPYVKEFHGGVPFEQYPAKLASLDLDLAIAPLEHNRFNAAKSNLRLLEYGILGWPVVCTDILPYQGAPIKRVPNNPTAWLKAIRERIHDLDTAYAEGDQLKQWVLDHWMLEDHLDEWLQALIPT
jgi:GT2 family glycosyltransferase